MVEEHDLSGSEHAGRNNKLSENIFGYRRSAGSDDSISACGSLRISGRFERRGSMQVTTAIFEAGGCPSFGSCRFA
jgi:hypothetical protein